MRMAKLSRGRFVKERRGVSEVIAILLLVVIVVAVVIFVLIFGLGVIRDLTSNGIATPVTASAQMFVPGSKSDTATLTLVLRNSQQGKIDNVAVSCPTTSFSVSSCVSMSYQNSAITLPTPLPVDGTAVGTATVTSITGVPFVAGTTYVVTITVSYINGSQQTVAVNVVAAS